MDPLAPLRELKHRAFVATKRAHSVRRRAALGVTDALGRVREVLGPPYRYFDGRYTRSFMERPDPPHLESAPCPRVIYAMWFGGPLPTTRSRSLDEIRRSNPDTPVVLITEATVGEFLLPEHPLHPAFNKLAATHRSDHLRAYLMHFHGGGYTDLKPPRATWDGVFRRLEEDRTILVAGYREITSNYVSEHPRNLGSDLRRYYRFVMGPSAFIMRPRSVFTASLYREQLRRLDYYEPALTDTPPEPYDLPHSYPLWWGELFPDIAQCLSLKFQNRIMFDDDIRPVLRNYR
ncbi:MAG TPA: hypothetical protein VLQ67_14805 [Arachnia sp.]|nr:hypothetical protein [Arachnia sp.]